MHPHFAQGVSNKGTKLLMAILASLNNIGGITCKINSIKYRKVKWSWKNALDLQTAVPEEVTGTSGGGPDCRDGD